MLNRAVEAEILPFCLKHNIGAINYAPMHSGLLTGAMTKERVADFPRDDFRRNAKNYQEPLLSPQPRHRRLPQDQSAPATTSRPV